MKVITRSIPNREGVLRVNDITEPDRNDPVIEFLRHGELIGTAKRNGHHLTWNSEKGVHSLPWVIYYYAYRPNNQKEPK